MYCIDVVISKAVLVIKINIIGTNETQAVCLFILTLHVQFYQFYILLNCFCVSFNYHDLKIGPLWHVIWVVEQLYHYLVTTKVECSYPALGRCTRVILTKIVSFPTESLWFSPGIPTSSANKNWPPRNKATMLKIVLKHHSINYSMKDHELQWLLIFNNSIDKSAESNTSNNYITYEMVIRLIK